MDAMVDAADTAAERSLERHSPKSPLGQQQEKAFYVLRKTEDIEKVYDIDRELGQGQVSRASKEPGALPEARLTLASRSLASSVSARTRLQRGGLPSSPSASARPRGW